MTKSTADAFAAIAQWVVQVSTGNLQRRSEAEDYRRHHCDGEREQEHRRVHTDHGLCGNDVWRDHGNQCFQACPGHQPAERRAAHGQQKAFDQELSHDPPAARAQSRTNGKFLFACGGAREKQARHIPTANQQKQPHGSENDKERRAKFSNDTDLRAKLHGP